MSQFDGIFRAMDISRSALEAQRFRLEVTAGNIARSDIDSTSESGKAYKARRVVFESLLRSASGERTGGIRVSRIEIDSTPGDKLRAPKGVTRGVDADGMFEKSNVMVSREMIQLIQAARSYEANIAAMRTYRDMFMSALTLGT